MPTDEINTHPNGSVDSPQSLPAGAELVTLEPFVYIFLNLRAEIST